MKYLTTKDKVKALVLILFLLTLITAAVGLGLWYYNQWLLRNALFGFTFRGIELRVILLGTFYIVGLPFAIVIIDDYLFMREWKKVWGE